MKDKLMVALDLASAKEALQMRDILADEVHWFKVGLRLFVAEGPDFVRELLKTHKVFLDLKFHDIPNTVAQAVHSAGELGVQLTNVHAAGGSLMLQKAAEAASHYDHMKLIAVSVLTSSDMPEEEAKKQVITYAKLTQEADLDGVVCSVHEAKAVKDACGQHFMTVTPGIRWSNASLDDQQRVADPAYALRCGADYLVVGRPILQAKSPKEAAQSAILMMEKAI
ncbi:MAG: orotidine-5'-phosphate decarboxylase [Mariprofundaceae bacterium]|nr:orotidine-5'-phosphate decarboxylase [Mariprofundaceae bacterium]